MTAAIPVNVICEFRYLSLGLSQLDAEQLLSREEPLAWAFAAFAKAKRGRAWLKLACLKRIARAGVDGVRQFLLVDAVTTRLQLSQRDEAEYLRLVEAEHPREVIEMQMTWSAQIEARAAARARKEMLVHQLRKRFGTVPEEALRRLEAITSQEALYDLAERMLTARSLEELGLL